MFNKNDILKGLKMQFRSIYIWHLFLFGLFLDKNKNIMTDTVLITVNYSGLNLKTITKTVESIITTTEKITENPSANISTNLSSASGFLLPLLALSMVFFFNRKIRLYEK